MTEELISRPISELAPLLRKRAISPVELFEEEGRQAAIRAEDEIQHGHYRGPILKVAYAHEQVTNWHRIRPAVA
jgi:hypothetical protein